MSILNTILVENNHYVCIYMALYTNIYIYIYNYLLIYLIVYLFIYLFIYYHYCYHYYISNWGKHLYLYICIYRLYIYIHIYYIYIYIYTYCYISLFPSTRLQQKPLLRPTWRCSWPTAGTATPGAGWAPASHRRCRPHRAPPGRRGSGAPP